MSPVPAGLGVGYGLVANAGGGVHLARTLGLVATLEITVSRDAVSAGRAALLPHSSPGCTGRELPAPSAQGP